MDFLKLIVGLMVSVAIVFAIHKWTDQRELNEAATLKIEAAATETQIAE